MEEVIRYLKGEVRKCEKCGKEFYIYPSQSYRRYCSRGCVPKQKAKGIIKQCEKCGKDMYITPGLSKKRFCSRACIIKPTFVLRDGRKISDISKPQSL